MNWRENDKYLELITPDQFSFKECLVFLGRSENECLHYILDGCLYKLIKIDEAMILLKISSEAGILKIEFPDKYPSQIIRTSIAKYIWDLFDLDRDLVNFYSLASKDKVLNMLVNKYYGLRIIGISDLFEALTWAIIGQQINLAFAYTLKKRFVESFGEKIIYNGKDYWIYPEPEVVSKLQVTDLTKLQFTTRKAEYVIGTAKLLASGEISKEELLTIKNYNQVRDILLRIRGVGKWTADYVMMKCLKVPEAFPIADVGLHNALKLQLELDKKPSLDEIERISLNWKGWEAYATFYLWRSLYE